MMNEVPVNIAIQLLPLCEKDRAIAFIDGAIDLIKKSGIKYEVGPFETTLEGKYDDIMLLVKEIKTNALKQGAANIIINLKISASSDKLLSIEEKVSKHR